MNVNAFNSAEKISAPSRDERHAGCERAIQQYGFSVSFIDDNSVCVRDARGKEAAFEFPLSNVTFDEYDKFIQQFQRADLPPPPIEDVKLSIRRPRQDNVPESLSKNKANSATKQRTWEEHAEKHGVSVDEMKWMYFFAQVELYARYKARLRS
jgi:hypothetical protein